MDCKFFRALFLWLLPALCLGQVVPPSGDAKTVKKWWHKHYLDVASQYEFHLESHPKEKLKMHKESVLTYSKPNDGHDQHGDMFVWTYKGRPQLIGSIWSHVPEGERSVVHEFQSLANEPLLPVKIGSAGWHPQAGVMSKPVPGALKPGRSKSLRFAQMRGIARQFKGFSEPGSNRGKELQLRMLPEPLYSYQSDAADCAIFCMNNDWDPEIILLVESSKSEAGPAKWYYSVGRFNASPLRLEHKRKDVWSVKHTKYDPPSFGEPKGTFFAVHLVEVFKVPSRTP